MRTFLIRAKKNVGFSTGMMEKFIDNITHIFNKGKPCCYMHIQKQLKEMLGININISVMALGPGYVHTLTNAYVVEIKQKKRIAVFTIHYIKLNNLSDICAKIIADHLRSKGIKQLKFIELHLPKTLFPTIEKFM